MDDSDLSDLYEPNGLPIIPLDSSSTTASSSGSGFSWSGLLSGITNLGTAGASAYKSVTQPTAAQTAAQKAAAQKAALTSYLPLILIGGGALLVIVIIFALLRKK